MLGEASRALSQEIREQDHKKPAYNMMARIVQGPLQRSPAHHWYVDSGSSVHFSTYEEIYEWMEPHDEHLEVITADGVMFGTHYGEVHLHVKAGNNVTHELVLSNVIYVANLPAEMYIGWIEAGFDV